MGQEARRRAARFAALLGACCLGVDAGVMWDKPQRSEAEAAIILVIEDYVRAIETKDVKLFRRVKPTLSEEEEKRLQAAFASVQKQSIELTVRSLEIGDAKALLKASRRDTLTGGVVSSFPQTFALEKQHANWVIAEIRR